MPDTAPARWAPINSIREWEQNPKRHDDANVHQIATSIKRHGFTVPILVWGSKRRIVAGHGRYRGAQLLLRQDPGALLALDAPGPGLVLIREMEFASEAEAAAYALADNRLTEANPMHAPDVAEIMRQIEAEAGSVEVAGYSEADIEALLKEVAPEPAVESAYTNKIKIPVYEPKLPAPPPISSMYDASKTEALRAEIDAANLPPDVAHFLRLAADRHTSFHFKNIAEFYAHASPEVQRLFEKSALVIIDFNAAIENGFVKLTERLAELAGIEADDEE